MQDDYREDQNDHGETQNNYKETQMTTKQVRASTEKFKMVKYCVLKTTTKILKTTVKMTTCSVIFFWRMCSFSSNKFSTDCEKNKIVIGDSGLMMFSLCRSVHRGRAACRLQLCSF